MYIYICMYWRFSFVVEKGVDHGPSPVVHAIPSEAALPSESVPKCGLG